MCIMQTELGLDSGDILLVKKTEIMPEETYGELSDRLSVIASDAIVEGIAAVEKGDYALTKQSTDGIGVVRKIDKEQAKIDFSRSAQELVDLIRALKQIPGIESVTITTNGVLLEEYYEKLAASGVDAITVSLDTLNPDMYKTITRRDELGRVLTQNLLRPA